MTQTKKGLIILSGVVIALLLMNSVFAITGSIGNARMVLYPEVSGWRTTTIEKSILVKNVNDEEVQIKLEVDEEGEDFLELVDTEFTLAPDTEKKAIFLVKVRKEGTYNGKINIFFSPIGEEKTGVVLSSNIIVIAKKDQGYEESEETNNEETSDETGENSDVLTGGAIGETQINKGMVFLVVSGILLLLALVSLVLLSKSKGEKKGGKLNARRKQ